jgi:hypothetical protein
VPWLLKALLLAARSKRGRELMFAGALAAVEFARSERARKLYGDARSLVRDPRPRERAAEVVRRAKRLRS